MRLTSARNLSLPRWTWALVGLVVVLSALAAGCGDDEGEPAPGPTATLGAETPTAAGEPTSTAEPVADAGFRAFVDQLSAEVEAGGTAALTSRMHGEHVVCEADDIAAGPGGPLCEFEGQEFDGYPVSYWQSEGAVVPIEDARTTLEQFFASALPGEQDEFGDGSLHVYAINVEKGAEPSYDIILSAIVERPDTFAGEGPLRFAVGTSWEQIDGEWRMAGTLHAAIGAEDFLLPSDDLVEFFYPNWEPYE